MIKVLVQGAFVSDKVAVVNFSGWERMIIKCEGSKKTGQGAHSLVIVITARQQLHHWPGELLNLFWGCRAGTTLSTARLG